MYTPICKQKTILRNEGRTRDAVEILDTTFADHHHCDLLFDLIKLIKKREE